jgi:hypothetical protein
LDVATAKRPLIWLYSTASHCAILRGAGWGAVMVLWGWRRGKSGEEHEHEANKDAAHAPETYAGSAQLNPRKHMTTTAHILIISQGHTNEVCSTKLSYSYTIHNKKSHKQYVLTTCSTLQHDTFDISLYEFT